MNKREGSASLEPKGLGATQQLLLLLTIWNHLQHMGTDVGLELRNLRFQRG